MGDATVAGIDIVAEPASQDVIITRTFDASRERVFAMYTDPEMIPRWWGPQRLTTVVEEMDVRPGGRWRHLQHDGDGNTYGFHGVYHDVVAPERIVNTFEFEGPGEVSLDITTLSEAGGRTTLTIHSVYPSVAARDGMLGPGALGGLCESMQRLDALLATDG